jgi:hypothetical protein
MGLRKGLRGLGELMEVGYGPQCPQGVIDYFIKLDKKRVPRNQQWDHSVKPAQRVDGETRI